MLGRLHLEGCLRLHRQQLGLQHGHAHQHDVLRTQRPARLHVQEELPRHAERVEGGAAWLLGGRGVGIEGFGDLYRCLGVGTISIILFEPEP